ncbi:SpoIIE family protein phosphatase [Streptomyces sp. NPDC001292]|uniref:SpoIIE family protein phosphatase n=1 Tax=Streptomyces sp. NPDC001292 TaxID=3364558 RepID=UPI00367C07BD
MLLEQFGPSRFVTGILANLDTATGMVTWTNHGHPPPVVIRGGRWTTPAVSAGASHVHRPGPAHRPVPRAAPTRRSSRSLHRRHHRSPHQRR